MPTALLWAEGFLHLWMAELVAHFLAGTVFVHLLTFAGLLRIVPDTFFILQAIQSTVEDYIIWPASMASVLNTSLHVSMPQEDVSTCLHPSPHTASLFGMSQDLSD